MLRLTFPFSRDVEGEGGRGGPWRICAYEVHVCARTRLRLCNVCVYGSPRRELTSVDPYIPGPAVSGQP